MTNNKASVAQLAERLPRKQVVGGSNPPRGLIFKNKLVRENKEDETR